MASSSISTGSNNSAASKRSDDKSGNTLDGIFKIIALSSSVTVDGTVHDNVSTTNNLDNSSAATPRRNNSKYRINDDEEYQLQQQQQHGTKANECNEAQYDIPINLSSNQPERGNQSVPVHNAEISLPSSEELKAEGHLRQSHGSSLFYKVCYKHRQRTVMVSLSLLIIIIVSTIIGISIQLLYLRNNSNSENDMYHRKVDLQEVISYLTNTHDIQFFSDRTSNTPQYMAAKWMAETDPANWDLPTASTTTNDDNYAYRYLARFIMALNYYALNGQYWTNPLNFLSKQDICSWVGYVDGSTSSGGGSSNELAGIFCDIQTNLPIDVSLCKFVSRFQLCSAHLFVCDRS